MENSQHVKSISTDSRSKNRIKYASSKQRAKRASADVYRSYKRQQIGVTSAATREERVHNPSQEESNHKKRRTKITGADTKLSVVKGRKNAIEVEESSDSELDTDSTFASELDLANDRNASEVFGRVYRELWPLVRSLPEVLHHAPAIVKILVSYLLSPESAPSCSSPGNYSVEDGVSITKRKTFIANLATTDILHLLAVLARDLRHEIHPFVHPLIAPRIVYDLLNPPLPPADSGRQPAPLNVTYIEAAFRTLSYVFRYDSEPLLSDVEKDGQDPCLEKMRQYYGMTLGHKRDYVRRLAAETFAPLVRKLKSDSSRRKHLKRVIRALAASAVSVIPEKQTHTQKRAQSDAVDGIAFLLFQTARGVPGRLHSKGYLVIRCVLDCMVEKGSKKIPSPNSGMRTDAIVQSIASEFMKKICTHLDHSNFNNVWKEMCKSGDDAVSSVVEKVSNEKRNKNVLDARDAAFATLTSVVQIIDQCISFREGSFLKGSDKPSRIAGDDDFVSKFSGLLQKLLAVNVYKHMAAEAQNISIQLLCTLWKVFPDRPGFASRLSQLLPAILKIVPKERNDGTKQEIVSSNPAQILAQNLLPFLPRKHTMKYVATVLLSAAAGRVEHDAVGARMLLHSVASAGDTARNNEHPIDNEDDDDNLFNVENASDCKISLAEKATLINLCLVDIGGGTQLEKQNGIFQLGYASRSIPFLTLVEVEDQVENGADVQTLKKVLKWFQFTLKDLDQQALEASNSNHSDASPEVDLVVTKALLIESFATVLIEYKQRLEDVSMLKKKISYSRASVVSLLLSNPGSIWAVKCGAAFVKASELFDMQLNDTPNEIFDALTPNLRMQSHFIRLHTLQILKSYPLKPFVTDHADLDLTDDLDEESNAYAGNAITMSQSSTNSIMSGPCDIISTLCTLESTPVNFINVRTLTSLLTRVEVLSQTGRLPVAYGEAAANHMLGIMNAKFSAIWPAAVRALIAIASSHEECAWPPLEAMLNKVIIPISDSGIWKTGGENSARLSQLVDGKEHHRRCVAWDTSGGKDASLFGSKALDAQVDGRVSRHQCTDHATMCELVWSVMEGVPQVTTNKSRTVVPIFLRFLKSQYYLFHEKDPDARELRLEEHIHDDTSCSWTRKDLQRKMLQKKLFLFLKMFAAVTGPQQLHKHPLLLSIFSAFLSHQDAGIAQLSLICVLKYKQPQVAPYADHLKGMLKKGELREALLKFDFARDSGIVDSEHRDAIIPLVSRILFGRLTARVSGGKSSKDTPAARRAAVLAFLSVLGENENELDPFIYLMIRSFVPAGYTLKPAEKRTKEDREVLAVAMNSVRASDVSQLQSQRQEGFLNLLSDVITQLGYGVKDYVSIFMSIILALSEYAGVGHESIASKDDVEEEEKENDIVEIDNSYSISRIGRTRILCFRRISDLLEQFASSHDFIPYTKRMWIAMRSSVHMLPGSVVNADKPPALLTMLLTISSHPNLIPLLAEHPQAIKYVIKCIAKSSKLPIIDASLKFVDNLLNNGMTNIEVPLISLESTESSGMELIRQYFPLLMEQFTIRLESPGDSADAATTNMLKKRNVSKTGGMSPTTRRELAILCRVSELMVQDGDISRIHHDDDTAHSEVLGSLCNLLIPFLSPDQRASEDDQLNVLGILNSILPKVESDIALSQLPALSRTLGPLKNKRGIASLVVRQQVASVIKTLSNVCEGNVDLKETAQVLWRLCAIHSKRIDEVDYDLLIPAINNLGDMHHVTGSWLSLAGSNAGVEHTNPSVIAPLIYTCFHLLFDEDGVVSRGASKALKTLIGSAAHRATTELDNDAPEDISRQNQWVMLVEKTIVPCIRSGLASVNVSVRRYYILLLAEVAQSFRKFSSPNLYGDLSSLISTEDPDLDFFLNITHVQIHRRGRGFQRLRKVLNNSSNPDEENPTTLTLQSLSNVLLPIALHPIYECKAKGEELYALEAIATVGAIAKHLSWNKYQSALWTLLNRFPHHPEQERYLIGAICSIIDAFHFEVESHEDPISKATSKEGEVVDKKAPPSERGSAVWRALERRIIPKVESYLIKEKIDRRGSKTKLLRSAVVLAMLKLFQKFPLEFFEAKLPRLLAVICDALKSKESDARDVARTILAKMCVDMGMKYLSSAIRELAVTLTEGYRLHVRMATLHSILLELSKKYKPPEEPSQGDILSLSFDQTVPAIMDLIQQDLFGEANGRKEAEGVRGQLVKEAHGSKSLDSIEIICRMLFFRPSLAAKPEMKGRKFPVSAVHAVVSPLLERLRDSDVAPSTIGKIRECLNRVVVGIVQNPSVRSEEIFPFIYASVEPFVGAHSKELFGKSAGADDIDSSDDEGDLKPIKVSQTGDREKRGTKSDKNACEQKNTSSKVVEWRPSTLKSAKSGSEARDIISKEKKALRTVQDGASAPKLTGSSRYESMASSSSHGLNDPAGISAVVFGLSLMYSILKKTKRDSNDERIISMMDPFIPMLTTCVSISKDNDIVLLSLRCLGLLLRTNLPSVPSCAKMLGTKTLDLLTSAGALSNLHHELTLGCFKTLSLLISMEKYYGGEVASSVPRRVEMIEDEQPSFSSTPMPLDTDQMQVLVSLLKAAVVESDSHNATLGLVKAIASRRFISIEFYDLMETLLGLSVRSQKATVRQQCSQVFMQYLIDYPMAKQRLEGHLKQIVLNIKYEYEDGRLSALGLVNAVVDKIPTAVLEDHAQLFFLPLVLQLVNDESKECREAVANTFSRLLKRTSLDVVQSFYDYTVRWSDSTGSLQQTSLQLFGHFIDARVDFMKRGNTVNELIGRILVHVQHSLTSNEGDDEWERAYFSLVCLEKLAVSFSSVLAKQTAVWMAIVKCLLHPHPWVKQVSSRMVAAHLGNLEAATFADDTNATFLIEQPGALFEIARNLCFVLNVDDSGQNEEISKYAIKSLTWTIQAMHKYPHLCFAVDDSSSGESADEDEAVPVEKKKDPVGWLMMRLSNIAKPKSEKRREVIFKCFAAFATCGSASIIAPYLERMLEPLHRSIVELSNKVIHSTNTSRRTSEPLEEKTDLAKDVMQVLEESCGTEAFLEAYASVKTKARDKREQRKELIATEAIRDPKAAASRKIKKHQNERHRRKRKVADRRTQRGATAKRRHVD